MSPDRSELGSFTAVPVPFHSESGTGNGNEYDVTPKVDRGVRCYIGAQPTALESYRTDQPVTLRSYHIDQPTAVESCQTNRPAKLKQLSKLYIGTQPLTQSYIGNQSTVQS